MTKSSTQYDTALKDQVGRCRRFIKKLEKTPTMHGQKWKDSMLRHYRGKLKDLLSQSRNSK